MTRQEYTALVDRAKQLSYEYYVLAAPSVSDAQFDALVSEIEQTESEHPEWVLADSPTQQVGSDLQDNGRRLVRHRTRMLSCQKAQTQEAVTKWLTQTEKKLKGAQVYALEWKYDGISCSLVYQDGELISAATRGDKDCGQDLLAHSMLIPSVPNQINMMGRVEVRGEIVCPKAELAALGYKDCRTAAAAMTNQVVPAADIDKLVFLAWQMDSEEQPSATERMSIKAVQELGFHAEDVRTCEAGNILSVLDDYAAERDALPYPTDGVVVKIDNKQAAASLGYTEHHPKGNIAYKFGAQKTTTKVLRIEISVGRTGKRTPVAYLKPVMIMGREVKQASLYSENKMRELGIAEGCTVEVGLSNDITPKIYRVIKVNGYGLKVKDTDNPNNSQCSTPKGSRAESENEVAMFNAQCSMEQSNLLRNSPSKEPKKAEEKKQNNLLKFLGQMAIMSVVLVVIWETGLVIPLGILGLISAGLLK